MSNIRRRPLLLGAGAIAGTGFSGAALSQQKEILIGSQCDRTGPTQLVGTIFCPAVQDYVNLINANGGFFCSGGCVVSLRGTTLLQAEGLLGLSIGF